MKNWIRSLVYPAKHEKLTDENIMRMILPSVIGIILCMVCLAGATWAWFSATVQTQPQSIAAANYDIEVLIENADKTVEKSEKGYMLSANTEYTVTLTATGTAKEFGGYCVINHGDAEPFYTCRILPENTITFTLIPEKEAEYDFVVKWGPLTADSNIKNGDTVGKKQSENSGAQNNPSSEGTDTSAVEQTGSENSAEAQGTSEPQDTSDVPSTAETSGSSDTAESSESSTASEKTDSQDASDTSDLQE